MNDDDDPAIGPCPECGGELDEDGVCPECGWPEEDEGDEDDD